MHVDIQRNFTFSIILIVKTNKYWCSDRLVYLLKILMIDFEQFERNSNLKINNRSV